MTTKARDATGVLRTIDVVKARGPDGVLRLIDFIRVRGADGVLREVFTKAGSGGGGTPPSGNPASITPGSVERSGKLSSFSAYFTAISSGAVPTAYAWSSLDGVGSVVSGATTNSAQLRVYVAQGDALTAEFACDMTINGVVYRATCTLSYSSTL